MRIRFGISSFMVLFAVCCSAVFAGDDRSIQGTLRDTDGALLVAGQIWAQRLDARAKPVITKTDDRGQYVFRALPVGTYRVTAYVDGIPRMIARVQTTAKGWTKLDFRLHEAQDEGVDQLQRDLRLGGAGPGR